MTPSDIIFLHEFLSSPQERVFCHMLRDDPNDELTRNAYADWLTDQGRPDAAGMVRKGYTPGAGWPAYSPITPMTASGTLTVRVPPYQTGSITTTSGGF